MFYYIITGELIDIEYLYSQTERGLADYAEEVLTMSEEDTHDTEEEDEGFEDTEASIDLQSLPLTVLQRRCRKFCQSRL